MTTFKIPLLSYKNLEIIGGEPDLLILDEFALTHKWRSRASTGAN